MACLVLAGTLLFVACEALFPGQGGFEPSGTQFTLNTNIEVISITGRDQGFPNTGTFPLSMSVKSKTSSPQTDTLPAGLLFRSAKNQVQHMLVLKPQVIEAGSSQTEFVVGAFCCNEYREIPRSPNVYELGPVTDNAGLLEIAGLVQNKDISGNLWMVQRAVWMVTDSTGLNQAYRDSLSALPPQRISNPESPCKPEILFSKSEASPKP